MTKNEILKTLKELKPFLQKYNIKEIGLFGSYVKNQNNQKSDIDIIFDSDFKNFKPDFMDILKIKHLLEDKFNTKVDLVPKKGLKIQQFIEKDIIYV